MPVCAATKRDGSGCTVSVEAGQTYCHHHDPARADARSLAASRAARSKPSREISRIKAAVLAVIDEVHDGDLERGPGAVLAQLYAVVLRAIERKVRETDELLERLERLEREASSLGSHKLPTQNGGARTWRV